MNEAARIEYLESFHRQSAATTHLLGLIDGFNAYGEKGIQLVAEEQPELILTALNQLADVVRALQGDVNQLVEHQMSISDIVEQAHTTK